MLMRIARYAQNIRLLLLSATPVYNNYKEIIWLTNLMNAVDKRSSIKAEDVFDKEGRFIEERTTKDGLKLEGGRELLKRKLTGYVSYVRGENPYTFPFRIYPDTFSPENTFLETNENLKYPKLQMNLKPIENPLQHLPIYLNPIGEYQEKAYKFIMDHLRNKSFNTFNIHGEEREMPSFENMESFGYTYLQQPLESLNIIFPNPDFEDDDNMIESNAKSSEEESKELPSEQQNPAEPKPEEEKSVLQNIGKTLGFITGGDGESLESSNTSTSSDSSSIESDIQRNAEIIKNSSCIEVMKILYQSPKII
jgi:hypothetical protein